VPHFRLTAGARRELLIASLGAMEASWLGVLFYSALTLGVGMAAPASPLPYLALMLLAYAVYQGVARLNLQLRYERWVMVMFLALVTLTVVRLTVFRAYAALDFGWLIRPFFDFIDMTQAVPLELMVAILTLILLARGIALASADLSSRRVGLRFRISILILGVVLLIFRPPAVEGPQVVFTFFFAGLCGIALARTEEAGVESRTSQGFGGAWLAAITGSAALVMLLAAVLSALLTGENIDRLLLFLSPLTTVLMWVIFALVYVVAGIFSLIVGLLWPILGPLARLMLDAWIRMTEILRELFPNRPPPEVAPIDFPPEVLRVLGGAKGVLSVLALLLVVLVIVLGMNLAMGRRRQGDEEHESLDSGNLLAGALRNLLDAGRAGLDALAAQAGRLGGLFATLTIRRIYAQMAHRAAQRGFPRARGETPLEYRRALAQAFPGGEPAIERITQAYLGIRYGELPEMESELHEVRQAWEQIRALDVTGETPGGVPGEP
jgi:hypothetical protein